MTPRERLMTTLVIMTRSLGTTVSEGDVTVNTNEMIKFQKSV